MYLYQRLLYVVSESQKKSQHCCSYSCCILLNQCIHVCFVLLYAAEIISPDNPACRSFGFRATWVKIKNQAKTVYLLLPWFEEGGQQHRFQLTPRGGWSRYLAISYKSLFKRAEIKYQHITAWGMKQFFRCALFSQTGRARTRGRTRCEVGVHSNKAWQQ